MSKANNILDFIVKYIEENKYSPTYQEIADSFNFSNKSHVEYYIKKLKDNGKITYNYRSPRSIRIVE